MKGRQFNKISISASLMIVIIAVFWVWNAYQNSREALERVAADEARQIEVLYRSNLEHFGRFMTHLATVIGNQRDLNDLFYAARQALEQEGGGAGGPLTAELRDELLSRLSPGWEQTAREGIARELHFHVPPATSFLRVHRPESFGEDLSARRATVLAANSTRSPAVGFEIGLVSGGIRGVVPITHTTDDGSREHIGSLEAGMGLSALLALLQEETGAQFALWVDSAYMRDAILPEAFLDVVADRPQFGRFRLMNTTDEAETLGLIEIMDVAPSELTRIHPLQQTPLGAYAVASLPLRDFQGEQDGARDDVGVVLAWTSLDQAVLNFKREVAESVVIALFVVFFLEAMLFFALGQEQKLALQRKASVTDALTGVSNRRHFDEVLDAEIRRAARSGQPVSVILADVDYFKRYNDHYGHQAGDDCLRRVATIMGGELRRAGDFIARYGGEEFVVVLPDTALTAGLAVSEKLRRAVESLGIRHEKHPGGQKVTISMGVASGRVSQNDAKALVAMADEALYRAKGAGRNNSQGLRFGEDDEVGQALPLLYR